MSLLLSEASLPEYRALRSLAEKQAVDSSFKLAQTEGAVALEWDADGKLNGFVHRITFQDATKLSRFLGCRPRQEVLDDARRLLEPLACDNAAIPGILDRWRALKRVRGRGPEDATEFVDATRVLAYLREHEGTDILIRIASVALFSDSKRLEALGPALDALTSDGLDAPTRQAGDVFAAIGLLKQPQPALFAGKVLVSRERASTLTDTPYSGFPASTVRGLGSNPDFVLVIENLTTFHQIAGLICDRPALAIYCAGMPSPSWRAMFARVLASCRSSMLVYHWGDIDEGGFRIAAIVSSLAREQGFALNPWLMSPGEVTGCVCTPVRESQARQMARGAKSAGWNDLAAEVEQARVTVEQEAIEPKLPKG